MAEDQRAVGTAGHAERDWSLPCTRAEAEAHVRAMNMRCRGPHKPELTLRDYDRLAPEVQGVLNALPAPVRAEAKRSPALLVAALLEAGYQREARMLDEAVRVPCGADFADVVLANPLDGRERAYTCPKCGVTGTFTSPVYHIAE